MTWKVPVNSETLLPWVQRRQWWRASSMRSPLYRGQSCTWAASVSGTCGGESLVAHA